MNQILSVERNGKNKNISSIKSILIVFSVILIIYGLGMTSSGIYSYYKNATSGSKNNVILTNGTKPVITIERESASTINIVVTHDKEIESITYTINDEDPVEVAGNGKKEIKESVELPVGKSTIKINAKDINGISASYESENDVEEKPTITLEQQDGKIKAVVESKINIDYIMYYWDEDEQNAKQAEINDLKTEQLIDVLEGTHTLNITAVDINGAKTTKTQKIIGDNKPTLDVKTNGKIFRIKAADDEELTKIEITLNSNETITEDINDKTYTKDIELENGENRLIITVYNKNGLSAVARVKSIKE